MNNKEIETLEILDFRCEIAERLELDFNRDIFDIQDDVANIISEKRQILELCKDRLITLNKLDINNLGDVKSIICYYTETRDKEDYDKYTYAVFNDYEDARNYYNKCITKTMKDWHESKIGSFDQFCKPGDIVGEDIVNEFLNSVPPVTHYETFIQAGEPYSHELDIEDNKFKATYTTFEKEKGHWIYKGNCFKNKNMDQTYKLPYIEKTNEQESEEDEETL